MGINAAPITDYRYGKNGEIVRSGGTGELAKWQIAWGNGVYYLWNEEIQEVIQELPGIMMKWGKAQPGKVSG